MSEQPNPYASPQHAGEAFSDQPLHSRFRWRIIPAGTCIAFAILASIGAAFAAGFFVLVIFNEPDGEGISIRGPNDRWFFLMMFAIYSTWATLWGSAAWGFIKAKWLWAFAAVAVAIALPLILTWLGLG